MSGITRGLRPEGLLSTGVPGVQAAGSQAERGGEPQGRGGASVPDPSLHELRDDPAVGADAREPEATAGSRDLTLDFLRADAVSRGYTCRKKGCRCGMTFEGYCRQYGIVTPRRQRDIDEVEVCAYEELSTWASE